jgi:hypothetical protein
MEKRARDGDRARGGGVKGERLKLDRRVRVWYVIEGRGWRAG